MALTIRFRRIAIWTISAAMGMLASTIAFAGDYAERAILGFSLDGRYFAFEQFGVQDGSGFPYSEIFVIDLVQDNWVDGTPIRVRVENEEADISEARQSSHGQVQPLLQQYGIWHSGRLIASAPVTEVYQDPYEVSFRRYHFDSSTNDIRTALLTIEDRPAPSDCAGLGDDFKGFSLRVRNDTTNDTTLVHQDNSIPGSRGCPLDYGISDIIVYPAFDQAQVVVALINVFTYGFEGSDRRYIAIQLPTP